MGFRRARPRAYEVALLGLLSLALVLSLARLERQRRETALHFTDFRIFLESVGRFRDTGRLYASERPDYFLPGSPVYKYPPPFAALLLPFAAGPADAVARGFLVANTALLALTLVALLAALRPALPRLLLATLAYLNWQAFWESVQGLQLEPLLLALLSAAVVALLAGREVAAGAALGVAVAFKVYPVALLVPFALRRRGAALVGAAAGALGTLALAGIVLPLRLSGEYFLEVLPRLGGTQLNLESVGLLAHLGRLAVLVLGGAGPAARAAYESSDWTVLGVVDADVPHVRLAAVAAFVPLAALLLATTVAIARRADLASPARAIGELGAATCLLLVLMPTSWTDYQTLLALSVVFIFARGGSDPVVWALAVAASALGALPADGWLPEQHRALYSSLRSPIPLLLWAAQLRLLAAPRAPKEPA